MLRRDRLPPPAASQVYELTDRGRELKTVILELGRWGSREPANEGPLGPDAAVIALMTMFRGDLEGTFELRLDGHVFGVQAADGRLEAAAGLRPAPTQSSRGARARSPRCSGTAPTPASSPSAATAGRQAVPARVHSPSAARMKRSGASMKPRSEPDRLEVVVRHRARCRTRRSS